MSIQAHTGASCDLRVWISAPPTEVAEIGAALDAVGLTARLSAADFAEGEEYERAEAVLAADVVTYRAGGPELVDRLLTMATGAKVVQVRRLVAAVRRAA